MFTEMRQRPAIAASPAGAQPHGRMSSLFNSGQHNAIRRYGCGTGAFEPAKFFLEPEVSNVVLPVNSYLSKMSQPSPPWCAVGVLAACSAKFAELPLSVICIHR